MPTNMGSREREILTAIIETYIATGEPVGSRTLARSNKDSLSPATIRNVMADLADAGLLARERTGREVRYRITPQPLSEAVGWMAEVGADWDDRLAGLARAFGAAGPR